MEKKVEKGQNTMEFKLDAVKPVLDARQKRVLSICNTKGTATFSSSTVH